MEKIANVFRKYHLLLEKFKHNDSIEMSHPNLDYLEHVILPMFVKQGVSLESFALHLESFYLDDIKIGLRITNAYKELEADISTHFVPEVIKKNWFLLTVNFNDKVITIPTLIIAHAKVLETAGIEFHGHVIEKFRRNEENGKIYIHHHIHYLIKTDYAKSKVAQFIFQKVEHYGVDAKHFIDLSIKGTFETKLKYIQGDKQQSKMECVQLDDAWRKENNLDKL